MSLILLFHEDWPGATFSPFYVFMIENIEMWLIFSLPMDSIWKLKVSSADNFLLDFNLPWRFTIFIHPERERERSIGKRKRKQRD